MFTLSSAIKIKGDYRSPSIIRLKMNDFYFLANKYDLLKISNLGIEFVQKFESEISLIYINDNYFIIESSEDRFGYEIKKNIIFRHDFIEANNIFENEFSSKFIQFYRMDGDEDYQGIYDLEDNIIIFKVEKLLLNLKVIGDVFFGENSNQIVRLNKKCSIVWQHDLSHLGVHPDKLDSRADGFSRFLGIANNNVFILSNANRIVVLDLTDGTLIKVLNHDSDLLPNMRNAFIHPEDKYIYCLGDAFVKINTETLLIERNLKVAEENYDPNVNTILYGIYSSSHQGNFISFASYTRHRIGFAKWIGLFDYRKEQVVWHYELLPAEGQLSIPAGETPHLAGKKLYVLDTDNTLHILEQV